MADYVGLGARTQTGVADQTGNNPGNWTVTFDPVTIDVSIPIFEVYKIVIHGAPYSTFNVFLGVNQWDTAIRGDLSSWDPSEPLIMNPGQYLYFYWSDPVSDNTPPQVVIWMRYDATNIQNGKAAH